MRGLVLSTLLLVLALGCDLPGKPNADNRRTPEGQVADFGRLFARHCAGCHGAEGKLGPAPPLNDPIFLAIVPDDELLTAIEAGRRGTQMPAFARRHGGPLTDEQVRVVAAGIKPRWQAGPPSSDEPPPYLARAQESRAVAATRGRRVFARACAACHGERGQGSKMAGAIDSPEFLQLISDRALRRIIITGRPDLGMPNYSSGAGRHADFEPLSSRDVGDLVEMLAQWRSGGGEPGAETASAGAASKSSQE